MIIACLGSCMEFADYIAYSTELYPLVRDIVFSPDNQRTIRWQRLHSRHQAFVFKMPPSSTVAHFWTIELAIGHIGGKLLAFLVSRNPWAFNLCQVFLAYSQPNAFISITRNAIKNGINTSITMMRNHTPSVTEFIGETSV